MQKQQDKTAEKRHSLTKGDRIITIVFLVIIFVVCTIYIITSVVSVPSPSIVNGQICRTYESLIQYLDSVPDFTSSSNYTPHIPKIVQNDIDIMLSSDKNNEICYYSERNFTRIIISKNSSSPDGIMVKIISITPYYSSWTVTSNISIYKKGNYNIVIYGTNSDSKQIDQYVINTDKPADKAIQYESYNSDLFGIDEQFDNVCYTCINMTLVRRQNSFIFYDNGEKRLEQMFPGGDIVEFNSYYILDSNNDLYYLYFCPDISAPWIKFVKVAENVNNVLSDNEMVYVDDNSGLTQIKYAIYTKNETKYSAILNSKIERGYGQSYGNNITNSSFPLDFAVTTIKLDESNVKNVSLHMQQHDNNIEWYIHYNYMVGEFTVYTKEHINELDSYVSRLIPEKKLTDFDGKTFQLSELPKFIADIKSLYEKYE